MRHFFAIGSGILLGLAVGRSQSLNIATWMVELPETNSTNRASEYEPVLRRVSGVLKPLNADILVLHGIPDRATSKQLTTLLRPRVYHTATLSTFKKSQQSPELIEPPVTILARKSAISARTIEWRTTGQIDAPGGFSVAIFNFGGGTNAVFVYAAQFPKVLPGMTPQQEAAIPRKRELSARYLVAHANWLIETSTNAARYVYMATDLELDAANATNDPVLAILTSNGFKPSSGSRTLVASTALSSTGWPPVGGLVSAFIRGADFPGDPESISRKTFFAPVALVEMDLSPANKSNAASASSNADSESAALAGTASTLGTNCRSLWLLGTGAALILGFMVLILRTRRARGQTAVGYPGLAPANAEMGLPSSGRIALHGRTDGAIQLVQRPARVAAVDDHDAGGTGTGPGAEETERAGKSSSWPFLHLLRERLVRWLAAERSQLLSSHHAGAEQVLELEERLTRIQNQFETRLRAREQRVSELEAELMTKEKAIGELEQALAGRGSKPSPSQDGRTHL